MKGNKKIKISPNLVIVLMIFATFLICFWGIGEIKTKELNHNIYINTDGIEFHDSEEKVLEDVPRPKSYNFSMPIFMYHFILDDYGDATDSENYVSPKKLEEQFKYIVENGYETVYITDIDKLYKYTKPVALTFDDCFVYFYNNAFPLLKKYNLKASIYIITNYINGPNYLTTEQLKEINESGLVDIQSHSVSHRYLSRLTPEESKKEIVDSKQVLKELLDVDSTVFCYPIGDYNKAVVDFVKENYDYGLNMLGGIYHSTMHSKYNIPRIYANRSMPMSTFINYLKQTKVSATW